MWPLGRPVIRAAQRRIWGKERQDMRTHCARVLLAVSASVLAGTLTATIALAATTWTVKPGGAVSAK
jgi:hypothetical protein